MAGKGNKSKSCWRLEDLIGFECALAKDEREDWSTLRERDASMAQEDGALKGVDRRAIFLDWLRKRMEREPEIKLAADSVSQSLSVAGQLVCIASALVGLGLATAALSYSGSAAINVSAFFGVFVLLQAVLGLGLLLLFLLPRGAREALAFGPLFRFGKWILEGVFAKTQALAGRFLSGQRRHDAAEWAGEARRTLALHGSVVKWVIFTKLQAAALCYNFGALTALLIAVLFSDRAFGWQTTLDVSEERVHEMVETAAAPWAWLYGEGAGYPDPAQIAGSRIVLKEGIRSLESENLAAWWQFLALGMLAYGILPRALFWGLGHWQRRATLADYDFGYASAERLMQRLQPDTSRFEMEVVKQGSALAGEGAKEGYPENAGFARRVRCLCSRELALSFDLEALREALQHRWKLPASSIDVRSYEGGRIAAETESLEDKEQVAIVFESWMPPIKEVERQVAELRKAIDERALIKVILLGIPSAGGEAISLKPEPQYAEAWQSLVRQLGDPYLVLENPAL